MNLMYPLCRSSKFNDFELRMSLRSVEKYLSNVDKIYIVGQYPNWLTKAQHIAFTDKYTVPDRNIMEKIVKYFKYNDGDVLFMNDDHYFLKPFNADNFPTFYFGTLEGFTKNRALDAYGKRAKMTLDHLTKNNLPTRYYDVHTPIVYNKEKFLSSVPILNWESEGFIIKSVYANTHENNPAEMRRDGKSIQPPAEDVEIYSTYPHLRNTVVQKLQELFPEPSRFEKELRKR